jgi:hypothetical protein
VKTKLCKPNEIGWKEFGEVDGLYPSFKMLTKINTIFLSKVVMELLTSVLSKKTDQSIGLQVFTLMDNLKQFVGKLLGVEIAS